jgi:hypothetical protein
MKLRNLLCVAVAVVMMVASATVCAQFQNSRAWNKLGASLQQAWLAAKKAGDMDRSFKAFARVRAPADPGDQDFLQSKGFNVRVWAGSIARGDVKASDLEGVANLPFVDSINLAGK